MFKVAGGLASYMLSPFKVGSHFSAELYRDPDADSSKSQNLFFRLLTVWGSGIAQTFGGTATILSESVSLLGSSLHLTLYGRPLA